MSNARNWYIYLTSAISLQSFTWATIALLRNLSTRGLRSDLEFIALQFSILVISFPVFLIHWLWAQRLAQKDKEEQNKPLRRFYFYAILAGALVPFLANIFALFAFEKFNQSAIIYFAVTAIPLAAIFYYHQQLLKQDASHFPHVGPLATIRRIYILGFSAAGLWMTATAIVNSLEIIFRQLGQNAASIGLRDAYRPEIVRLILGAAIWIYFWNWAQKLFAGKNREERHSALRKFYLYTAVFLSALGVVGAATGLLAGLIRRLFSLPPSGNAGTALSIIIGLGLVWALHAYFLRQDGLSEGDKAVKRGVRRIYLYLVAAIGLAAVLIGVAGNINVLIRAASSSSAFGTGLREQAAWFIATLLAGLPVWYLPWGAAQKEAEGENQEAAENRNSVPRRNYLYFYLFIATITVLGSLIYIVFQLLLLILGERFGTGLGNDLAQAISFAVIGVGVLAYHGGILRNEGRLASGEKEERLAETSIAVLDGGEGKLGASLVEAIQQRFSTASVIPLGLTTASRKLMNTEIAANSFASQVKNAHFIIAPWHVITKSSGASSKLTGAIMDSSATKIFLPNRQENYYWAGVETWSNEGLVEEAVKTLSQVLAGEEVKYSRGLGCGTIAAIGLGLFFLLVILSFFL